LLASSTINSSTIVDEAGQGALANIVAADVAVSRAQALSMVFASPRLLDVPCRTIEQMRLVNALCAVADYARAQPLQGTA
jgi:uncharacterized protein